MTTDQPTVVGVGNALVDHTYLLTNLPEPDGGAYVLERERRFGGVETNVVVTVAALGVEAGIVTRIGTDPDGERVRDHLRELPLHTDRVQQVDGDETSYTHVLKDPEGRRVILGGGDSTLNLTLDETDRGLIEGAQVAVTSAYAPASVIETLAGLDTDLVFDLAGAFEDLEHRGLSREALTAAISRIDCLVTNEEAARSYLRAPDPDVRTLASRLADRGVRRGAVTCGADGAVLFDGQRTHHVDAVPVEVVDTTGAGDAFTAGLVVAWVLEDHSMAHAGRFATAAAAAACRVEGAHDDPPSRATVEALLD